MQEASELIACHECDAVYQRLRLKQQEIAHCERCGAELERNVERQLATMVPLAVACLIVFIIANTFPIVQIEMQGIRSSTTLLGAVIALTREGMAPVAVLVLATTMLFPLLQLLILLYLLLPLPRRGVPAGFNQLARLLLMLRPWGMVEVFLLGVLVALIKLSSLAEVIPGVALWAFAVLTVLLVLVVTFSPRYLWQVRDAPDRILGKGSSA
ncbi:paraquat-inducible protein A [Oxalobacteraceae bacterium CAVE-383]|nr:paraquat-inducible protein A [Oxalobacteraceae bacterium CAVE-383]